LKGVAVFEVTKYRYTKRVWKASFGEVLTCEREPDNASDRYTSTVAVIEKSIPDEEIINRDIDKDPIDNKIVPSTDTRTRPGLPRVLFELASKFHTITFRS
jgi:hypothetical protein